METTKDRAATVKLEPGQHSIDRAVPFGTPTGWGIQWSMRMPDGSVVHKQTKADTVSTARARAHRSAETLLRAGGSGELFVPVYADLAKTHRARDIGVLHPGVRDHLKARRASAESLEEFIVGAPADPTRQWALSLGDLGITHDQITPDYVI